MPPTPEWLRNLRPQQIIGGKVVSGVIENQTRVEVVRADTAVGTGKIVNLQKSRTDAAKVEAGNECGLLVASDAELTVGDHLIIR